MDPVDISDNIGIKDKKELALKILQEKTAYCYEGGGVLGLAYTGAIIRLYELGGFQNITHAVGSSVGSLIAIAIACKATPYYIKQKIVNMDLQKFKDGGCILIQLFRLLARYGRHKGDEIERFVGEVLHDLTGNSEITFGELYSQTGIHLTITYLSTRYKKTKYADHINNPNDKIKTVARWSSAIPIFFKAPRKYKYGKFLDILSDGGVADNYPIHVLRDQACNPVKILGFKLLNTGENRYDEVIQEDVDHGKPKNIIEYIYRIMDILREQALRYHVDKEDWKLTCKIDIGKFQSTDFDITETDKLWLYDQGTKAMDEHLIEIEELLEKGKYPL